MERTTDTIAAVATPCRAGGYRHPASVRAGGRLRRVRRLPGSGQPAAGGPSPPPPDLRRPAGPGGAVIDKVLATYTRGPASYTGEDTAELHCHGAPMVLSLGLESLFSHRARQAGPGEFTRRAFLNGRLDLVQAEAVGDLLEASSWEGARHAAGQLSGALSRRIGGIYSALVDVMAHFHAVLDYPDEDIDPLPGERTGGGPVPAGRPAPGPSGHLPPGQPDPPRPAVRHRGPPQRGQVLPAQRPAGLRTGHCH